MRRFTLRLLIALITFAIGVAAAALLGGLFTPLTERVSDTFYLEIASPPPPPPMPLAPSLPCNTHDSHLLHPLYMPQQDWHERVVPPHAYPVPPDAPAPTRPHHRR